MEAKATPEEKELSEIVAFSPNWCQGVYHRPECPELPRRHKQQPLHSIIDETQGVYMTRNPCIKCKPPTAGRKFWHKCNGVYHDDYKCEVLLTDSKIDFFKNGIFSHWFDTTQMIHTRYFKGFCVKCVKLEKLAWPEAA